MSDVAFPSDVILITSDDKKIESHKAVLATYSGSFANAFRDLPDDSAALPVTDTFECMTGALSFMYGSVQPAAVSMDNYQSIVATCSKYDISKGLRACDSFLTTAAVLSTQNLPGWKKFADRINLPSLLEKCVKFAAEQFDAIVDAKPADQWMKGLAPATMISLLTERNALLKAQVGLLSADPCSERI